MPIQLCKNKGLAFFTVILLPALVMLGFWQLNRAEEKRQVLAQHQQKQQRAPLPWDDVHDESDWSFLPVKLRGRFDNQHNILLDNRMYQSQVGYEVLTPFKTANGSWVLINRGWAKAGYTRDELPEIAAISDEQIHLIGDIYVQPPSPRWFSPPKMEVTPISWPLVVQAVDSEVLEKILGVTFFPHQIRLREQQPGALPREWQTVNVKPQKHIAYAVQWFALGLALVIWYLLANTNLKQTLFSRNETHQS